MALEGLTSTARETDTRPRLLAKEIFLDGDVASFVLNAEVGSHIAVCRLQERFQISEFQPLTGREPVARCDNPQTH